MTWSNLRFSIWRSFVAMATNLPSLLFNSIFRITLEVSSKLYVIEISEVSEKLWLFNHKGAEFWLPNFGLKNHFSAFLI